MAAKSEYKITKREMVVTHALVMHVERAKLLTAKRRKRFFCDKGLIKTGLPKKEEDPAEEAAE